jgi:hypothetical protein
MADHRAAFSPARWVPVTVGGGDPVPGVWTKELLTSGHGDSFALLRLDRGAKVELPGAESDRILVLDGEISVGGEGSHLSGAYRALPAVVSTGTRALVLVLRGERLGAPVDDVFSPQGWSEAGPGQWFRLLADVKFDESFDERLVGLSYFEPGSSAGRHPHPTAHRFLFLDGEADDELVFPDGTCHTVHRAKGDFVDYPHPIEHQTFSRTGCTILFLHEPLPA